MAQAEADFLLCCWRSAIAEAAAGCDFGVCPGGEGPSLLRIRMTVKGLAAQTGPGRTGHGGTTSENGQLGTETE